MYRVATFLVEDAWGDFPRMVDALTVLLLTWNEAFYRYGAFDQDKLENLRKSNWPDFESYRKRAIGTWSDSDTDTVSRLFVESSKTLASVHKDGSKSAGHVAAAKSLHLLSPSFFPLWDARIAKAYGCDYAYRPSAAYLKFCEIARFQVDSLYNKVAEENRENLLKLVDEYNYARFTRGWI
jgi:hypothetical protein